MARTHADPEGIGSRLSMSIIRHGVRPYEWSGDIVNLPVLSIAIFRINAQSIYIEKKRSKP